MNYNEDEQLGYDFGEDDASENMVEIPMSQENIDMINRTKELTENKLGVEMSMDDFLNYVINTVAEDNLTPEELETFHRMVEDETGK